MIKDIFLAFEHLKFLILLIVFSQYQLSKCVDNAKFLTGH